MKRIKLHKEKRIAYNRLTKINIKEGGSNVL
jgi:hypothetical protein